MKENKKINTKAQLVSLIKPYRKFIFIILILSLLMNGLSLIIPKIVATVIDTFSTPHFSIFTYLSLLLLIALSMLVVSIIQTILQTYLSERIALDLRNRLIVKIAEQQFSFIAKITPEKLLTNLTGDIDNIKQVLSQGLVQIFSSIIIIIGASILLLTINWRLALVVLIIIPLIATLFFTILRKIRKYFIVSVFRNINYKNFLCHFT